MAMGNSLGLNPEAGKNMAMTLTGLVGDIASFYNISVEEANTAISSIYTGETESIKKLGIVLTEANLNAYAVSQGIQKTYNQMTQAEKVMLRYNYVMQASSKIQGDFARTSGNWANQVRVLKEQWSQLLSILGKGLIAVLNPIVKVMNTLLASVISVANAFSKAFGGQGIQKATSSVSSSVGGITDGVEDTTDGFDQANNSAKKLQNTLAGFDELNVLSKADSSGSGGGSAGGSTSGNIEGIGDIVASEPEETPASKLSTYLQECKDILDKWAKTIPKLEINFDKEKAIENLQNIGKNVLNTIAGWGSFVISIAIQVANDLDIGALANSFLNLVDSATGLASAITDTVIPAIQRFYEDSGLKSLVQWIGQKFKDGLDGLAGKLDEWAEWFKNNKETIKDFGGKLGEAVEPLTKIVRKIGDTAWNIFVGTLGTINGLVWSIANALINMDVDQLRTLMLTLAGLGTAFGLADIGLQMIGTSFKRVIQERQGFDEFLLAIKEGFLNFGDLIATIPSKIGGVFSSLGSILSSVLTAIHNFRSGVIDVFKSIGSAILHPINSFKTLLDAIKMLGSNLLNVVLHPVETLKVLFNGLSGVIKGVWAVIKAHPFATIIAVIALVIASIVNLYNKSEEFRNFVSKIWDVLKDIFGEIGNSLKDLWDNHILPLWEELEPLLQSVGGALGKLWDTISTVIGWIVGAVGGSLLTGIASAFKEIIEIITKAIGSITDIVKGIIQFIDGIIHGDFQKIIDGITNILQGLISFVVNIFTSTWRVAWEGVIGVFRGLFQLLPDFIKKPINSVIGFINGMLKAVVDGVNWVIRKINTLSFKVPDWVPGIGGQQWGFNFRTFTAYQIPLLANGGVIEQPTVAMMGEYAGASNNPEIATPQSLLQQIIDNSNNNVVDALIQQTKQLLQALENVDMSVSIGDDVIARSAQRGNVAYRRMTGKPLFV